MGTHKSVAVSEV